MQVRKSAIGAAAMMLFLAAQPGVAWAASTVSGSYLSYTTNGSVRESAKYAGPIGGQIRLCADQQGADVGLGGSVAEIKRSITAFPDTINRAMVVEGGNPARCTAYTSSSSNAQYYTRVSSSFDGGGKYTGWAKAEKP